MVIQCIYIINKKFKAKGYGKLLLKQCLIDSKRKKLNGVVIITRKGTWMPGNELFIKNDFKIAGTAPPDFELLVKKFNREAKDPEFNSDWEKRLSKFNNGLYIFSSDQRPYLAKTVPAIIDASETEFNIKPNLINLNNYKDAQNSLCAFGMFCIVYNGKVLAVNPISSTRFCNIMRKELN